jgi:YVTN family beta-propeller protein
MKTFLSISRSNSAVSRSRIAVAGILLLGAAALAAVAVNPNPPKLPWATPVIAVGTAPTTAEVDPASNTIYVPNPGDNTISVIDGRRCNASNHSRCSPVATMTNVGFAPTWLTLDGTTRTLYVTDSADENGDPGYQIAVLNVANCNTRNTSGCDQAPVALVTVGATGNDFDFAFSALDSSLHTLYVGDVDFGPLSMINTATCNALQTSGCSNVPTTTATGLNPAIDLSNHSVYVGNLAEGSLYVFNGATCNADDQSDCSFVSVAQLPTDYLPYQAVVDPTTHSIYLPLFALVDVLGYAAVMDGSTCNAINHSGCGQTPQLIQTGAEPLVARLDPNTRTVYITNGLSASLSVINAATCNGLNPSGCPGKVPALAAGLIPGVAINSNTHTIYSASQDTNVVWVLDASKCNGSMTSGCTDFAPVTLIGAAPVDGVVSARSRTLYVSNQADDTVSIIDTRVCNQGNLSGCNQTWPTINVGVGPRFQAINNATNTLYVANIDDSFAPGWISVINAATCNSQNISNCAELAQIPVGASPQQMVIDEATNTIYVENQRDNDVSIIDLAHCNANDVSACNQAWPTAAVGASPQGLGLSSSRRTLYVANANDNTVSVISTVHCAGGDTSGCSPVATVPVGAAPRAIAISNATNGGSMGSARSLVATPESVYVGNRDDLTVSVFDGSTCNGTDTSGCPQIPPPAFLVGAFPDTAGNDPNIFGRAIVFDSRKHTLYMPLPGDADVATVDTNQCRAGQVNNCNVKIMKQRAGGFAFTAALDDATNTVYVVNFDDGSVSIFPK